LRKIKPWAQRLDAGERPVELEEKLSHSQLAMEGVMLGLRTPEGVDLKKIRERFDVDLAAANPATLEELDRRGLARLEGECLRPTLAGMALADSIAVGFDFPPNG
jgi:coproporphyrinogen III oxidase-like Fe-S oxidoreductase